MRTLAHSQWVLLGAIGLAAVACSSAESGAGSPLPQGTGAAGASAVGGGAGVAPSASAGAAGAPTGPDPFLPEDAKAGVITQTSQSGDRAADAGAVAFAATSSAAGARVVVDVTAKRQTIVGIGSSLTQASAEAMKGLTPELRQEIINAHFSASGAAYSLSRTHVGSCDFSTSSYCYVPEADPELKSFSIAVDQENGLLPLILDAKNAPGADFKLMASPWTAPPWMKTNGKYYDKASQRGGALASEHYDTFARYMVKYAQAYRDAGVPIWAVTPVNEPMGNNGSWESMELSPAEELTYVRDHLAPRLKESGLDIAIFGFDHNRAEAESYANVLFAEEAGRAALSGTAVHWYNSTVNVYEDVLDRLHERNPEESILHTEGTVDDLASEAACNGTCREPPCGCEKLYSWWQNDAWFWEKSATDWGWDWSPDRLKVHPKYEPVHRYVRDIIVGLNHWFVGWIDWNFVLDKRGGPNHVGNYCIAPVMVDGATNSVHYTPIFYAMAQLSRNIRPGAVVLGTTVSDADGVVATAVLNPNDSVAVHVFNPSAESVDYRLQVGQREAQLTLPAATLQTIVVNQ